MGKKYRRYKNAIEKYLASERGRRFFHVAYSVGAAIVIVGALFKINHYPMGSLLLLIGMVVEAFIFLLSSFDRPSREYKWEEVYPVFSQDGEGDTSSEVNDLQVATPGVKGVGGTVIIGGGSGTGSGSVAAGNVVSGGVIGGGGAAIVGGIQSDNAEVLDASEKYAEQLSKASENMEKFAEITNSLAKVSDTLLNSFKSISDNSEGLGDNTQGYITQMQALNRNLTGLNTIYEVQLKGVSGQIHTIEEINAGLDRIKNLYHGSLVDSSIFKNETEKMAQQLSELNRVYARLLQAMTVNMNMNMGGFSNNNMGSTPRQDDENKQQ